MAPRRYERSRLKKASTTLGYDLSPEDPATHAPLGVPSGKLEDLIEAVLGVPGVDCAVNTVGFGARGQGGEAC